MSIANVSGYSGISSYYPQKTRTNSAETEVSFSRSAGIYLHKNDAESGNEALSSIGFPDGTSMSVFSAEGYSKYTVKYWNEKGEAGEYACDVKDVNPGNANYLEMLALSTHLDITKQTSSAFGDFINIAGGVNGDRTYDSGNLFDRYDFRSMTGDFMQAQYRFGNMAGYLSVKKLYDHITPGADSVSDITSYKAADIGGSSEEKLTPLGMGFANAGNMGYGMSASLVTSDATDDVIVRVKVAKGGGNETVDVNLSEFDPKNATAVEMFAYCQYKDATGGADIKWGSWHAVKSVISPADGMDFGSIENIINEKRNWTDAIAKSKTSLENRKTGETVSAADVLALFEEKNKPGSEESKDGDDWRGMSDDDWDKLLSGVDKYIDAYKADIRERVKKQIEAANRAAQAAESAAAL